MADHLSIPRGADGIQCPCGGYAKSVSTTHEERMTFDCGRYQMLFAKTGKASGFACCAVAFECAICHRRIAGTQNAPEMQ